MLFTERACEVTNMKNSFVLYNEYKEQFSLLSNEEAGRLIMAIFEYTESGNIPELEGMTLMAFSFIKKQLDRDSEKYEKTVEKRKEAGKTGGRPKTNGSDEEAKKANGFSEKAKKANGFSKKQTKAKKPVDVDVNEDVDEDVDVDVNVDVNDDVDVDVKDKTDYQLIADMYNATCVSFPRCTALSDSRKKAIKARLNKYSYADFQRLFDMAEESDFLKGSNNRDWSANFDWLIKDANMAKVLDGNYSNRAAPTRSSNIFMDIYNEEMGQEHEQS